MREEAVQQIMLLKGQNKSKLSCALFMLLISKYIDFGSLRPVPFMLETKYLEQ